MKKSLKKVTTLLLALLMVLGVCATAGAEGEPFTITISTGAGKGAAEAWQAVAEGYKQYHPEANIVIDLKPGEGYGDWVQTVTADYLNQTVDIVNINQAANRKKNSVINWNEYMEETNPYDAEKRPWKETFSYESQTRSPEDGSFDALNLDSVQVVWFYNMDIFEKVGVTPPKTWDELVAVCEKLDAAGYQPITIEGDYRSFFEMRMGWLSRIYPDQTCRTNVEIFRAQPDDFCYDPDVDGLFKLDLTDPWNDKSTNVTANNVRYWKAIKDGVITFDTEGQRAIWNNFKKVFPKYAGGDAFFGTTDCMPAFYQGKAAITVSTSGFAVSFARDMEKLASGEQLMGSDGETAIEGAQQFRLGTFNMPSMTNESGKYGADEIFQAPVRTIEVATGFLGAYNRSAEQSAHIVDFMMYYTSKEGMSKFVEAGLANGWTPDGTNMVYGVTYPEKIQSAFDSLEFIGDFSGSKCLARGLGDNQESTRAFYDLAQKCLNDEITVDEFCVKMQEQYMQYFEVAMPKTISMTDLENPAAEPSGQE